MANKPIEKVAFTLDEACESTGIGKTRLYEALKTGALKSRKYGKRQLILRGDLDSFLLGLPVAPGGEAA